MSSLFPDKVRLLLILLLVLPAGRCLASPYEILPSLRVSQTHNDNIFFDQSSEKPDWITAVSPSLTSRCRSARSDFLLMANLTDYSYADNNALDNTDQFYLASWSHALTPRWKTDLRAEYLIDSRRDRDLTTTGLLVAEDRRERRTFTAGTRYQLDELASLELSLSSEDETYDDPELSDMQSLSLSAGYSRRLTERSTGLVQLSGAQYGYKRDWRTVSGPFTNAFEEDRTITTSALVANWLYDWSERLGTKAAVGGRHTLSDETFESSRTFLGMTQPPVRERQEDESWSMLLRLNATWAGETGNLEMALGYDLYPASGRNGTTRRTSAELTGYRRLYDTWLIGVSAGYFANETQGRLSRDNDIDEQTLRLAPYIHYRINDDWRLELTYTGTWIHESHEDNRRHQNQVSLAVRWEHDLFH